MDTEPRRSESLSDVEEHVDLREHEVVGGVIVEGEQVGPGGPGAAPACGDCGWGGPYLRGAGEEGVQVCVGLGGELAGVRGG